MKFLTLSSWESSSSLGFGFTSYIQRRKFSVVLNIYSEKFTLCEDIERANKPQLLAASPKISELWANTKKDAYGDIFTFKGLCKGHATTPNSLLLLKKIIIICIHYMSYIFQKRKAWVCYMNNRSRPQNEIACPKASSWQPGTYKMEVLKRQTSFIRNSPKCSHTTFFLDLHVGYRFQSSVAVISIVIINHMIVGIRIIEPQTEHVQRMTTTCTLPSTPFFGQCAVSTRAFQAG